ncbi:MAG: DUF721 domain-containing protein [Methylotenera sp.]|nr:DUF721 domain-containing protein [Methylotenera sp.]
MQPLNVLLKESAPNVLQVRYAQMQAAEKIWHEIVPENLAQYTQAISIKNQQLTLLATNNAVAAKIKLLSPSLLIKLEKQGCEVTAIRVKVQVKSNPPASSKPIKMLSREAVTQLNRLKERLSGSALGEAISRVIDHANKP